MKKLLLTTSILVAVFATPALAENCADMIADFDTAISSSTVSDDAKTKALVLREQGAKQQAAGDDKSCVATMADALQQLRG